MAAIITNISDNNSNEPLSAVQGGTGFATCSTGDLVVGTGTNTIGKLSIGAANNILTSTGSLAAWSGNSSPIYTTSSASTSISAAVCTGYSLTGASLQTVTLPTTFAVGAQVAVQSVGAGGFTLKAGTGTTIQFGTVATSSGGSLSSTNQYDGCTVIGIVANTTWSVLFAQSAGLTVA